MTANSDLDYGGPGGGFGPASNGNGPEMDKWRLETERGMAFRLKRHAGPFVAGLLSMLALISPILMAGLPKVGVLGLKSHQVFLLIFSRMQLTQRIHFICMNKQAQCCKTSLSQIPFLYNVMTCNNLAEHF